MPARKVLIEKPGNRVRNDCELPPSPASAAAAAAVVAAALDVGIDQGVDGIEPGGDLPPPWFAAVA